MQPPDCPEMTAIALDEPFEFGCHPGVPCFNHCCRDLNQALTPYDVLQLRRHLGLSWASFVRDFADVHMGPSTGLPVVSLQFHAQAGRLCPFVTSRGCRVYVARPTSCRLYPLARALQRNRADGRLSVHYALLRESHCRGFEQPQRQTVRRWIADQQLAAGLAANDELMQLIVLKNQRRPGALAPRQQQWALMALYDLDTLKTSAGTLPAMGGADLGPPPDHRDDPAWLAWGLAWIQRALLDG